MIREFDIEKLKYRMRRGCKLRNRGEGWRLEPAPDYKPKRGEQGVAMEVPDAIVALLVAQGCLYTKLQVVGTAGLAAG